MGTAAHHDHGIEILASAALEFCGFKGLLQHPFERCEQPPFAEQLTEALSVHAQRRGSFQVFAARQFSDRFSLGNGAVAQATLQPFRCIQQRHESIALGRQPTGMHCIENPAVEITPSKVDPCFPQDFGLTQSLAAVR